jgi:tRNA threonylcarbamoyladenosine biosynthesis protein TsaE
MTQNLHSGSLQRRLTSVQETMQFGERLGRHLSGGDVLAFTGDLGAGKTVLTRGVALGLGIPADQVSSPTFTLIQEYSGPTPLIHVDVYRLEQSSELSALGLEEYFTPTTIVIIEWAERFPQILPSDHLVVRLEHGTTANIRLVTVSGIGSRSSNVVQTVQAELEKDKQ